MYSGGSILPKGGTPSIYLLLWAVLAVIGNVLRRLSYQGKMEIVFLPEQLKGRKKLIEIFPCKIR